MSTNLKARLTISILLTAAALPQLARADDWGCQVALCIANPAGATAVPECVPVMQRLYDALRNKRPWPSCDRVQAPAPQQFFSPQSSGSASQGPNNQPLLPTGQQ